MFPSVSAGWIMTQEGFLEDNNVVSFLKLRASYGLTGNAEIGNFASRGLYQVNSMMNSPVLYHRVCLILYCNGRKRRNMILV